MAEFFSHLGDKTCHKGGDLKAPASQEDLSTQDAQCWSHQRGPLRLRSSSPGDSPVGETPQEQNPAPGKHFCISDLGFYPREAHADQNALMLVIQHSVQCLTQSNTCEKDNINI